MHRPPMNVASRNPSETAVIPIAKLQRLIPDVS